MFDLKQLDKIFNDDTLNKQVNSNELWLRRQRRKMRFIKLAFPAAAAALVGLLAVLPSLREHTDLNLQISKPGKQEIEKLHAEKTTMYVTDKANRVSSFVAETIDETESGSQIFEIKEPHGQMPTSDEHKIDISAPVGFYDQNTKIFSLKEKVNIVYSDGMTANTAEAFYDSNISKAYGDMPISANGKYGQLKAQGFEYYTETETVVLKGKTDIHAAAEAFGEKTDIYAEEKVEIYRAQQMLKAFGNAVMSRPKLTVKADVLTAVLAKDGNGKTTLSDFAGDGNVVVDNGKNNVRADHLKTFFKKGKQKNVAIDRIEMTGNVKTKTADAEISATKGIYYPDSGTVKLLDDVIIIKNGNRMQGSSAETNLNTGISKMQSGGKHRVSGVIYEDSIKKKSK